MLLFDCSKVGSRADQMGLSETLTSSSSLLSLLPMSALDRIADSIQTARQVRKVPKAEMRCRLYCKSNTLLDFPLLLKQGERTKHEEHDLVRRPRRTQCSDSICARFYQVRVAKLSVKRLYNSDNRSPVSLVRSTGDKGLVALRNSRKRAFCCRLRPFMPGITTSETDAFILIRVAESIFGARPPAKHISPAQRRDDVGADTSSSSLVSIAETLRPAGAKLLTYRETALRRH